MADDFLIDDNQDKKEEKVNLYALVFKYLIYWPWFLTSIILFLVLGYLYIRKSTPVYQVNASVLIKEDNKRGFSSQNPLASLSGMGMISMTNNFDNEIEILNSRTLMKKVVIAQNLYISYFEPRTLSYTRELYKTAPFNIYMTPEEADKLSGGITLKFQQKEAGKWKADIKYWKNEEECKQEATINSFPQVINTPVGVITVTENPNLKDAPKEMLEEMPTSFVSTIQSPTAVAIGYRKSISIEPTSKTTTIAQLTMKSTSRARAVDFINTLVAMYNKDANDEKNEIAEKTGEFIDKRIQLIGEELGNTENELADFKQRSGLTNLSSDAELALKENSEYNKARVNNSTQIRLVEFLRDYIDNPQFGEDVIPSNVGLEDKTLTNVINTYNAQIIERKRLLRTSSEENPTIANLDVSIEATRRNVRTTVASVLEGLMITKNQLDLQARKFENRISDAPQQEKELISISRQREIKATLYTILLQKREENAITLASTANNSRIVEEALAANRPVSPRKKIIMLISLIVGMGLPFGVIYLVDLLKYKIENTDDIRKITDVPILAELPIGEKPASGGAIVVRENANGIMEEVFRSLRTNLLFLLKKDQKVIMFSSTQPGEGKSFVAGNTAVSLALMGKKVIIIGMDIRKPGLNKVFHLSRRADGITSYLSNPEEVNLFDMIQQSDVTPNLDILPGGPIPPNPTELVSGNVLPQAIAMLKDKYDYIIMDTAPIGMVTDSALIAQNADICVYVCRADVTPKAGFEFINTLRDEEQFPQVATVLNAIDLNQRKHSYAYGYGKKYGYGYGKSGYGYGYGYGYEDVNTSKKKKNPFKKK